MKRIILIGCGILGMVAIAIAQGDSVIVEEPSGFEKFYSKYADVIFLALAAGGVITWLNTRLKELRNAVDLLLAAGDEDSLDGKTVSLVEWQGIIAAFKQVFWKGETKKVKDLKRPNQ